MFLVMPLPDLVSLLLVSSFPTLDSMGACLLLIDHWVFPHPNCPVILPIRRLTSHYKVRGICGSHYSFQRNSNVKNRQRGRLQARQLELSDADLSQRRFATELLYLPDRPSCTPDLFSKMARRLSPLYVFDDPAEFYHRHSSGVLKEFENESREIKKFNDRQYQFKTWVIAKLHSTKDRSLWLFLVRPGEGVGEQLWPREGETCEILLWNKSGKTKRWETTWEAERIENPAASFGIPEGEAHRMPAFKVKIPGNVPVDIVRPIQDDPDEDGYDKPNRLTDKYALGDRKAYKVTMTLRVSEATKKAEVAALDKVCESPDNCLSTKQAAAFKYLLTFKDVPFTVNMFEHFPHLRDPINNPAMPPKVIAMLKGFNQHQAIAYRAVLSRLPCGVGIIPGGPGAGKTHWNLALTAAIQSRDIIDRDGTSSNRSAKVLYLLDINKPLDDTCNKIVRLYKSLGLKKRAVRLYGWSTNFASKFLFMARVNRYRRQTSNSGCLAPTLDELAWEIFTKHKTTRYQDLARLVSRAFDSTKKDLDVTLLNQCINDLYREVLDQVNFIATTPVPASSAFDAFYRPDLVIFDESPHAREASTMIAIAQYNPIAWIFSGVRRCSASPPS